VRGAFAVDRVQRAQIEDDATVVARHEVLVAVAAGAHRDAQAVEEGPLDGSADFIACLADFDAARAAHPALIEATHERRVAPVTVVDHDRPVALIAHCSRPY
jgi:hypothetical protein